MAAAQSLFERPKAAARSFLLHEIGRGTSVNLGFALANAFLTFVTAIFTGRAFAAVLGQNAPAGVGILSLGFLVLEFAGVLDNFATSGFIRDYAASPDPTKFWTIIPLKFAIGLATTSIIVITAWPLAAYFTIPVGLLLILATIPTVSSLSSISTMFFESQRMASKRWLPGTAEALVKVVLYALFWVGLYLDMLHAFNETGVVLTLAGLAIVASLSGSIVGLRLLPRIPRAPFDWDRAGRYLRFGLRTQATGVLGKVIFWGDILLIDIFLGLYDQGLYRTAYAVMAFVPLFASTVSIFLYPALAEAVHRRDHDRVHALFLRSFRYVLAIAVPLVLAAFVLAKPALYLFGGGFENGAWILQGLALISILPAIEVPLDALFPALGRPDIPIQMQAVMAVVNVGLDLVLIPGFSIDGVQVAPRLEIAGALVATGTAFICGLTVAFIQAYRLGALHEGGKARFARAVERISI
ncbi:MAG: oligosaccharide flippase family protein [Thermoplasmatota archaeon]